MSQSLAAPVVQSIPASASTGLVTLWKPTFIGIVTFLLGWPAGIGLAVINWIRMDLRDKAILHVIGGAAATLIFVLVLELLPGGFGQVLGLAVNLAVLLYLQKQMTTDIDRFKAKNHAVKDANRFGGCLIGLGLLVLFLCFDFVIRILLVLLGPPIPN